MPQFSPGVATASWGAVKPVLIDRNWDQDLLRPSGQHGNRGHLEAVLALLSLLH